MTVSSSLFNLPLIRFRSLSLLSSSRLPLSSLRSVSISPRKFRAFSTMTTTDAKDAGMDDVQRRLMFEDECILVDETDLVVGFDTKYNLDYLLFIVRDVKVQPNPDEVAEIKYVSREELKELVKKADAGEEGLKLSPWFRLVVDNFLMKWWDHVEKGTLDEAIDMKTIHKL
ncbi:hypothetical protein F2Q70_00037834 [Brassica cretica]|uniref:Nudix hydrolase domain-containing protein n=1 Tax=Brassica cretica TaxID=69181 RepID=A0A8S9JQQ7_BRACR|nr:hypothetical protein F2Q70_00037834 [Brassica cretica]